jgi:hypothetical protein
VRKIPPPTGIRCSDCPARSDSLYRLRYPGPRLHIIQVTTSQRLIKMSFIRRFHLVAEAPFSVVISVRPFVCPHVLTRLPLDEFSWHFTVETFMKYLSKKSPCFVKIGQKCPSVYMKIYVRLYCRQQYEIFCSLTTLKREAIGAFPWKNWTVLRRFCKTTKTTIRFVMSVSVRPSVRLSVRPHATTRLRLNRLLWNLIFDDLSKICLEYSS